MFILPIISFAKGLIQCGGQGEPVCDFTALMSLVNTIIHFILFYLAIPISAIMFFYAGFLMVTSAGSSESKTKAKGIFSSAVYGLVVAAAGWLIIRTILQILGFDGAWIGF